MTSVPSYCWNSSYGCIYSEPVFTKNGRIEEKILYLLDSPKGTYDPLPHLQQRITAWLKENPSWKKIQYSEMQHRIRYYLQSHKISWKVLITDEKFCENKLLEEISPVLFFSLTSLLQDLLSSRKKDLGKALRYLVSQSKGGFSNQFITGPFWGLLIKRFSEDYRESKYWISYLGELWGKSFFPIEVMCELFDAPAWDRLWGKIISTVRSHPLHDSPELVRKYLASVPYYGGGLTFMKEYYPWNESGEELVEILKKVPGFSPAGGLNIVKWNYRELREKFFATPAFLQLVAGPDLDEYLVKETFPAVF